MKTQTGSVRNWNPVYDRRDGNGIRGPRLKSYFQPFDGGKTLKDLSGSIIMTLSI